MSSIQTGKDVGSFPEGFTSPNKISKSALPYSCPANQVWIIAFAFLAHGILIGDPVLITRVVFSFTSKIDSINLFWFAGKLKSALSFPSVSQSEFVPTIIITWSAFFAVSIASENKSTLSGVWHPI